MDNVNNQQYIIGPAGPPGDDGPPGPRGPPGELPDIDGVDLVEYIKQLRIELDSMKPIARIMRNNAAIIIQRWWRDRLYKPPNGKFYLRQKKEFERKITNNGS